MNALYIDTHALFWVEVAKYLYYKYNWKPTYWVDTYLRSDILKENFSDIVFHETSHAVVGLPALEMRAVTLESLDTIYLEKLSKYEPFVLKMFNRQDPYNLITYDERKKLFLYYVQYWTTVLKKLAINIFIAPEMPHRAFDFTVYAICQILKIPVLFFRQTSIINKNFLLHKNEYTTNTLKEKYLRIQAHTDIKLSENLETQYKKIRSDYTKAVPVYMKKQFKAKNTILNVVNQRLMKAFDNKSYRKYFLWAINPFSPEYINRKDIIIEPETTLKPIMSEKARAYATPLKGHRFALHFFKRKSRLRQLKKAYDRLVQQPDLTQKYIYVTLHYQPERTSLPEGGIFENQLLMIDLLAKNIPPDWKLYIKEHPSQFILYFNQDRSLDFYEQVNKYKNTLLIPITSPNFDLIDNAKAVTTLTGTSGWEAINRSIPALIFGYPWYQLCEGVFTIQNTLDLQQSLQKLVRGYKVNQQKVRAFWKFLEMESLDIKFRDYHFNNVIPLKKEVQKTCEYIYKYYRDNIDLIKRNLYV